MDFLIRPKDMIRHFLYALAVLAALASWQGCKETVITPPFVNEPDTVHSTVSAIVNHRTWAFKTPDTVSRGAFTNAGVMLRDEPIQTYTFASHMTNKDYTPAFTISLVNNSQVVSQEIRLPNNTLGVVRSWISNGVIISFILPKIFSVPISIGVDSLRSFSWAESIDKEEYRLTTQGSPGSGAREWVYGVYTLRNDILSVAYSKSLKDDPFYDGYYNSRVERAWLRIERYDTLKKRVSGTFSFRLVNIKGEVVDIRGGIFDNVRLHIIN